MNYRRLFPCVLLLLSSCVVLAYSGQTSVAVLSPMELVQGTAAPADFIQAEQLKARLSRNERLILLDVRDTSSFVGSSNKIKGAFHVKLRRLNYRLSLPPLRDISRDSEVVTYCACPNDEASIRAARILSDSGFKHVYVLKGGWRMWLKVNGPVEPRPRA